MIHYRKTIDNSTFEFVSAELAQAFATEQGFDFSEFEEVEIDDIVIDYVAIAKKAEYELYVKRREDGIRMFLELISELRLVSKANSLPREWLRELEGIFEKVQRAVESGQWKTAQEECELIPVDGLVTQQLYDRIYNAIVSYIATSYQD